MCLFVRKWEMSLVSDLFPFKIVITTREYREAVKWNTEVSIDKITNIKVYFPSFLNPPFTCIVSHWSMASRFHLNLNYKLWAINRSVHETFPHWEKRWLEKEKKTARFLTAPSSASLVRRFQGVLVKAVGNRSHTRKRPTSIVRFERAYLNCNSFWNDNTFGKNTVLRDWPVSPRTRGDNSADLLWKALVSRRCISAAAQLHGSLWTRGY